MIIAAAKGCLPVVIYGRQLLRKASIPIITRAVAALLFVVINLAADIVYAWADPRVRLKD